MSMQIVVGYQSDERGVDALATAAMLAAAQKVTLTVVSVYPPPWPVASPARVDAEWVAFLAERSNEQLVEARAQLAAMPWSADVDFRTHANAGSGRGLLDVAISVDASLVVVGSAPKARVGQLKVGSTADQLLHSSPIPVMVVPRGYGGVLTEASIVRPSRVSAAYEYAVAPAVLSQAAQSAKSWRAAVRVLAVVLTGGLRSRGLAAEQRAWAQKRVAEAVADLPRSASGEVLSGRDAAAALSDTEWEPGEILFCGSSQTGPLRKVFLSDLSGKIIRAAQCPTIVIPRTPAS